MLTHFLIGAASFAVGVGVTLIVLSIAVDVVTWKGRK